MRTPAPFDPRRGRWIPFVFVLSAGADTRDLRCEDVQSASPKFYVAVLDGSGEILCDNTQARDGELSPTLPKILPEYAAQWLNRGTPGDELTVKRAESAVANQSRSPRQPARPEYQPSLIPTAHPGSSVSSAVETPQRWEGLTSVRRRSAS